MPITWAEVEKIVRESFKGKKEAGLSIDLKRGMILTGVGFCVAYSATQDCHDTDGLKKCMDHATGAEGSGIVGAWQHNACVYYDSVKKYATRQAAVDAAQKQRQLAIYNLGTQQVEDIMSDKGSFNPSLALTRKRAHSV